VSNSQLVDGWPGAPGVVLFRVRDGNVERIDESGDLNDVRAWASVSKMAVALAFGVEVDEGLHEFTEHFGPHGATLANLLSHSSGLGYEEGDREVPLATKRVYSNVGIDHAVHVAVGDRDSAQWLEERIFTPLGMDTTQLWGRPCADGVSVSTRNQQITPYLPELSGIVPGFGRFSPCAWGLGPELRGTKQHWMGDWPAQSFGHFGQSGAMLLLNADEQIGLAATSTEAFGPWAVQFWPGWTSMMRQRILSS
jgi:CubicO group peptidase (beta-lactamase class C family)